MTAIAGLIHEGRAYVGADSLSASSYVANRVATPKVFRRGPYVIAITGTWRIQNVLHYRAKLPPLPDSSSGLHKFVATKFVDAMREALKGAGSLKVASSVEDAAEGGSLILGVRDRLFQVMSGFEVLEHAVPWITGGSGSYVMSGALFATQGMDMHPRDRLRLALRAAEECTPFVRGPFRILVTPKGESE